MDQRLEKMHHSYAGSSTSGDDANLMFVPPCCLLRALQAVVLLAMGGYGSYLGWQIRLAGDAVSRHPPFPALRAVCSIPV